MTRKATAAEVLQTFREEIERKWAKAVREQIASASGLEDPILFNYFPGLLQRIAETLGPDPGRMDALEGNTSAMEHGGERARLTNFNITQIATEFYLLKEAIYAVVEDKTELTARDRKIIDRSIDLSLQESISTFALAEAHIREQFIAMLAHDIRGPIAFIRMATSLLMEGVDQGVADDLYQRIADATENAGALIDNILDASLIKSTRRIKLGTTHCHILGIAQKVIQQYKERTIELQGTDVAGYWCPRELSRVLQNLIDNAIKYGDSSQPIVVNVCEEHESLQISVHNKGKPIPIIDQENIFQPFYRAHQEAGDDPKGWGFGLPIVRGITEAHGGTIEVDSTAVRGTTITIKLPLDARPYQNRPTLG
jgi:signal transduction histidine kinase